MCTSEVNYFYSFNFTTLCSQIDFLVAEGASFGATPTPSLSINVKVEELDKRSTYMVDKTKKFMSLTVSCVEAVMVCSI